MSPTTKKRQLLRLMLLATIAVILLAVIIGSNCRTPGTNRHKPTVSSDQPETRGTDAQRQTRQRAPVISSDAGLPDEQFEEDEQYTANSATDSGPEASVDGGGIDSGLDTKAPETQSCTSSDDCGCGQECTDHKCVRVSCCEDSDCPEGKYCDTPYHNKNGPKYGACLQPQCNTDTDCGSCGRVCYGHKCKTGCSEGIPCCGTDICSESGYCYPHEYIENGRCRKDANCPKGKYCSDDLCVLETCTDNASCEQCNYICNRGFCKYGCEKDADCCDSGVCYNGRCEGHATIEDGRCLEDRHCPKGEKCLDQQVCVPTTCTDNASCGECELVCEKGTCIIGCNNNADCCEGTICDHGDCRWKDD